MNKPKFNPNQPFDAVKPKFDPNQPFQDANQSDAPAPEESGVLPTIVDKLAQGGAAGFADEASGAMEAMGQAAGVQGLGGKIKDIQMSDHGPTMDWEVLKHAYLQARNKDRDVLKKEGEDHPLISGASELAGAVVSPVNKLIPTGASGITSGAIIGGAQGFGNSEADNAWDMTKDTAMGAGLGGAFGYGADKAAPYIEKGAQYVGGKLKDAAENLAFKAGGAMLKDFRKATSKGNVNEMGRYILDNGLKAGDSVENIADRALSHNASVGSKLDDLYNQAGALFKDKMSGAGFDPIRDKAEILKAARNELGGTVGAEAAINKLSDYLDEVATRHGDAPMQSAMHDYEGQVDDYLPKQRQFLKDKKAYQSQVGKAGEDLNQPVLPGAHDDFQRTGSVQRELELNGKSPSQMSQNTPELETQMDLPSLPQNPGTAFNSPRGDNLLPLNQQMALDDMGKGLLLREGQQGTIDGLGLITRTMQNVEDVGIHSGTGQMEFPIAPEAPLRPVRPDDIRNPMSPRATNDIKSSLDQAINYSRNPLAKEPASEIAYSAARNRINQKNLEALDSMGGGEIADTLRATNKEYGLSKQVGQIAQDRVDREAAHKMFGLTDAVVGAGALGYGAVTGDWKTAGGVMLAKKGIEKYGASTLAVAADKISKQLLKSPQMQQIAAESPKVFNAMVYSFARRAEESMPSNLIQFPKAADKDQGDGAMNFQDSSGKDAILQKAQGSKYAGVLQKAAANGDDSLNAAHYILSQRDPEYRKATSGGGF